MDAIVANRGAPAACAEGGAFAMPSIHAEFAALEIKLAQCADDPIGDARVIAALQLLERLFLPIRQSLTRDLGGSAVKGRMFIEQAREQALRIGAQRGPVFGDAVEPLAQIAAVVQRNGVWVERAAGAADAIVKPLFPRFVRVGRREKIQFHARCPQ